MQAEDAMYFPISAILFNLLVRFRVFLSFDISPGYQQQIWRNRLSVEFFMFQNLVFKMLDDKINLVNIVGSCLGIPKQYTQPTWTTNNNRIIILVHKNWLR